MRRLGVLLAAAGFVMSLAATPALADRDRHDGWRNRRHHGDWDRGDRHRTRRQYYRDYDRSYYYEPRVEYYAVPRVYIPAPPSFGLNLVFPIH